MGKNRVASRLSVRTLGVIAALVIDGFAGIALWLTYHDAEARAEQRTQALAQVYAEFATRSLEAYDHILVDLQGLIADGMPPEALANHLRRQKAQHVNLLNLFAFDAQGAIAAGTQERTADLSDRDYVVVHREDAGIGRFVGRPGVSRLIPGRRFFPMSRRVSGPDGELIGVVAATVDLKDLADAFDAVRDGAEGPDIAVALVHQDGTLYVRSPAATDMVGRKFTVENLDGDRWRTTQSRSPVDGTLRIVTQRQVPRYPLVVMASLPHDRVLAEWAVVAAPVVGVALLLTLALALLANHLHAQAGRRERLLHDVATAKERAEHALAGLAEAQEAMVRTEKLAALGELVAGVAQEIDIPVADALAAATTLAAATKDVRAAARDQGLPPAALTEFLNGADEAVRLTLSHCHRAAELIHGFKQVAVDQTSGESRHFNLAEYVAEVLLSLRPKFRHTPHRVDVYVPDDIALDSYPGALSQVLTHLVMNSLMHGFDDGRSGIIDIAARQDGDVVELIYSDNGKGIPAALHARVFEPFFTTRRGTGGSGLGLAIVHNIVHRTLGGTLRLDSQAGRGVHFTIRFPLRAPAGAAD